MFLAIVAQEAKRLSSLVNDILSLSRVQQKREAVQTELVIHDMVAEQWQHVMPLAETKAVQLRNDVLMIYHSWSQNRRGNDSTKLDC